MPFQPGKSGNPEGRPRGSRNRSTTALRALLESEAEEAIRTLATAARNGNVSAAKALLDRILPPMRSGFIEVEVPLTSDRPLTEAADAVIRAVAEGSLAPGDAVQVAALLKIRAELTQLNEVFGEALR